MLVSDITQITAHYCNVVTWLLHNCPQLSRVAWNHCLHEFRKKSPRKISPRKKSPWKKSPRGKIITPWAEKNTHGL